MDRIRSLEVKHRVSAREKKRDKVDRLFFKCFAYVKRTNQGRMTNQFTVQMLRVEKIEAGLASDDWMKQRNNAVRSQ